MLFSFYSFLMEELTTVSTAEMLFYLKQMNIFHSLDPLKYLPHHDNKGVFNKSRHIRILCLVPLRLQ